MKLKHAKQVKLGDIQKANLDVIIVASGYESRCCHLSKKLTLSDEKKIVIAFKEKDNLPKRKNNDAFFRKTEFEFFNAKEGSYHEVISILNSVFSNYLDQESLDVLIDYSCMTKVWYSTILNYFQNRISELKNINLFFSYSPSVYSAPQPPMPNKYMGPIPGIFRVSASNKPTALIIGLGYELQRAKGIAEYLDPDSTYAFYSKPAFDPKFVKKVEKNNLEFISSLPSENVIPYPVYDLNTIDSSLTSLCLELKDDHRVILAPLGPKPFALMCLLLSFRYSDIDVWRVSAGNTGNVYDRKPAKEEPIICQAVLEKEMK